MEKESNILISYRKMNELLTSGKLDALSRKQVPRKISFWIARLQDCLEREMRVFTKLHEKMLEDAALVINGKKQFTDLGEGRKQYRFDPIKQEGFNEAFKELLDTEVDLPLYRMKIKLSAFPKTIPASDLYPLVSVADIEDDLDDSDNVQEAPQVPGAPA